MSFEDKPDPFLVQKPARDRILPGESAGKSREAFRSIGEAAAELGLKTHVLRFWETKFDALKPMKRADGRRYYRPEDMEMLRRLQDLLHVQGLTIRGAARVLVGGDPGDADATSTADDQDAAQLEDINASVRGLQHAVRDAVDRGEFRAAAQSANEGDPGAAARSRLESLLSDLSDLKSRLDAVRNAA